MSLAECAVEVFMNTCIALPPLPAGTHSRVYLNAASAWPVHTYRCSTRYVVHSNGLHHTSWVVLTPLLQLHFNGPHHTS